MPFTTNPNVLRDTAAFIEDNQGFLANYTHELQLYLQDEHNDKILFGLSEAFTYLPKPVRAGGLREIDDLRNQFRVQLGFFMILLWIAFVLLTKQCVACADRKKIGLSRKP